MNATHTEMPSQICARAVPDAAFSRLCAAGLSPLLARVYAARGIEHAEEVDYSLGQLLSYETFKGMQQAVHCLSSHIFSQAPILIIGDFDADGATSTALAVHALRAMGAEQVDYLVPNRFTYGYGLTPEIVAVALSRSPKPALIITVDNGISSAQGVKAAQAGNVAVLITDHHLPGEQLPPADAIVNPNQPGDTFPSKNLAGVGVIFYVMLALRAHLREAGWFDKKGIAAPNMAAYLDLVALGTVADVVPLDQNNRVLIENGLQRIRARKARAGIRALIRVAQKQPQETVSSDLGYAIAPRLNAAGRLEDMSVGIACLLSHTESQALAFAQELDTLNQERRQIEQDMQQQALSALDTLHFDATALPVGLCVYRENWHQGVIGIVAGRLKTRFHRPVAVFTRVSDTELKASLRSIPGVHIRDVLADIARLYPGMLTKFGGHAQAAGLTLLKKDYSVFKTAFIRVVGQYTQGIPLQAQWLTDGRLPAEGLTLSMAQQLRTLPWGQAFPVPLFANVFRVVDQRILKARHIKFHLETPEGTHTPPKRVDALYFNVDVAQQPALMRMHTVRAVFTLDVNAYQGVKRLQLLLRHVVGVKAGGNG